nr:PREDICTED: zinc finger BED domain-containing protein 5-like [Tribolium castaneum]XP_015837846.1 PREDICTED: zinc finger BED domain-containing protein 5-like [Tribolium castaneum]XP_015837945.1 PREDICTED: zinc finger BED domain-containing protein 5-like [Tribolium castaneum]XP_015840127.1 PREDICTED: zinc finger BED domain-containing protein 5 isoform X2 [Tribolium castaneum]|eukprot:XP_015833811.1 PREDICTED: zinc finger BED domain-containing protein 5-like [Tribolium castaneum]
MDESTDVAGLAILLVFVRYIHESSFEEDMLFCKALPTQTTGEEIFNLLNAYFEKHSIPWNLCYHICTDGAKAMTSKLAIAAFIVMLSLSNGYQMLCTKYSMTPLR